MSEDGTPKTKEQDGDTPETVTMTIADRDKLVGEATKYRKQRQDAEARNKALEGQVMTDEQRAEYDTLKQAQEKAAEDKAREAGQFDDLLAQKQAKFDDERTALTTERDTILSAFTQVAVLTPLQAELARAGVTDVDAAAHLIQTKHPHRATAQLVDGKAVVRVVDGQGNPVTDADSKGPDDSIGIDKLVAEWVATDTGKRFLPPSGDTGSGAHNGGKPGLTWAEVSASAQSKVDFIEKHGSAAYQKLAQASRRST